jgi:hypothetical protein
VEKGEIQCKDRKSRKHQRTQPITAATMVPSINYACDKCGRRYSFRIGLFSHSRR